MIAWAVEAVAWDPPSLVDHQKVKLLFEGFLIGIGFEAMSFLQVTLQDVYQMDIKHEERSTVNSVKEWMTFKSHIVL